MMYYAIRRLCIYRYKSHDCLSSDVICKKWFLTLTKSFFLANANYTNKTFPSNS